MRAGVRKRLAGEICDGKSVSADEVASIGARPLIFDPVQEASDRAKPCTEAVGRRTRQVRLGTEGERACAEGVDGGGQGVQAAAGPSEPRTSSGQTMTDRVPSCT